jgi:hypothetical protein
MADTVRKVNLRANQSTGKEIEVLEVGPNSIPFHFTDTPNDIRNGFMSFGGGTGLHFSKNFEPTLITNKLSTKTEGTLYKFHNTL